MTTSAVPFWPNGVALLHLCYNQLVDTLHLAAVFCGAMRNTMVPKPDVHDQALWWPHCDNLATRSRPWHGGIFTGNYFISCFPLFISSFIVFRSPCSQSIVFLDFASLLYHLQLFRLAACHCPGCSAGVHPYLLHVASIISLLALTAFAIYMFLGCHVTTLPRMDFWQFKRLLSLFIFRLPHVELLLLLDWVTVILPHFTLVSLIWASVLRLSPSTSGPIFVAPLIVVARYVLIWFKRPLKPPKSWEKLWHDTISVDGDFGNLHSGPWSATFHPDSSSIWTLLIFSKGWSARSAFFVKSFPSQLGEFLLLILLYHHYFSSRSSDRSLSNLSSFYLLSAFLASLSLLQCPRVVNTFVLTLQRHPADHIPFYVVSVSTRLPSYDGRKLDFNPYVLRVSREFLLSSFLIFYALLPALCFCLVDVVFLRMLRPTSFPSMSKLKQVWKVGMKNSRELKCIPKSTVAESKSAGMHRLTIAAWSCSKNIRTLSHEDLIFPQQKSMNHTQNESDVYPWNVFLNPSNILYVPRSSSYGCAHVRALLLDIRRHVLDECMPSPPFTRSYQSFWADKILVVSMVQYQSILLSLIRADVVFPTWNYYGSSNDYVSTSSTVRHTSVCLGPLVAYHLFHWMKRWYVIHEWQLRQKSWWSKVDNDIGIDDFAFGPVDKYVLFSTRNRTRFWDRFIFLSSDNRIKINF